MTTTMVLYRDNATNSVISIPASDVPPGAVQMRMEGHDEPVWVSTEATYGSLIGDADFQDDVEEALAKIGTAFSEHRQLSAEQWGHWIRSQEDPDLLLSLWQHAADVYLEFAGVPEVTRDQRHEIYELLKRCVEGSPAAGSRPFKYEALSEETARAIVIRFQTS